MSRFSSRLRLAGAWGLLVAMFAILVPTASAQLLQGSLDGSVVDSSQAAIPGAAVTLTNEQTGTVRTTETGPAGGYSFPTIASGVWMLEVRAEGFQTFRQTGINVRPNAVSRADVTLEVGQVTETIEVSAQAATLQTDRAEVRQEVNETALKNLPVPLGRNYQNLFVTLPGVSPPTSAHSIPSNPTRSVQFSVNGTARQNNNTRIDGASVTNIWLPHMTGYTPALEAIEQVNVTTSSMDAEQGLAGGASVNLSIKSGTNEIHGSAFEYHTNQKIKAYPWSSNRADRKPKFIYNQFGATIGGPIKKNKAFYFVSYEGTRESQLGQKFVNVATGAMRQGDLSQVFTDSRCNTQDCNVYDPLTGDVAEMISPVSAGGGFTRTGICTIVDMDSLEVEVDVNEAYINRVRARQPVQVTLNAYPEDRYAAEVIAIIPTADRSKATVRVRVGFLSRDERVLPDMGVRVAFLEEAGSGEASPSPTGVLVPRQAIARDEQGEFVFLVTDERIRRRSVTTGGVLNGRMQVVEGLTSGDRVVADLSGDLIAGLADGDRVSVLN